MSGCLSFGGGRVYRLLRKLAQVYRRAHQSCMESLWEVTEEGFFEKMKPGHILKAGGEED